MSRYRAKGRGKSKKIKWIVILCLLIAVTVGFWLFFRSNINPVVLRMSESTVKSLTTSAVNEAVYTALGTGTKYEDLITVTFDKDGKISMLQANSVKINELARTTERYAEKNLEMAQDTVISIPIGSFMGSPLLANTGPPVDVKILPIGAVTARFRSEFEEAGINQTRHKIILEVSAAVDLVIPFSSTSVETKTQVLITESILVGSVPEVYLKFSGTDGPINLVPRS